MYSPIAGGSFVCKPPTSDILNKWLDAEKNNFKNHIDYLSRNTKHMAVKMVILWTDALTYLLLLSIIIFIIFARRYEPLRAPWREVTRRRLGMAALVVVSAYASIALLDSIHFQSRLTTQSPQQKAYYSTQVKSVLDVLLSPLDETMEVTYSAPFASHLYIKELVALPNGQTLETYPHLQYNAAQEIQPGFNKKADIVRRILLGIIQASALWIIISLSLLWWLAKCHHHSLFKQLSSVFCGKTTVAWRETLLALLLILLLSFGLGHLAAGYHILGTDKVGQDVFYQTIKSIRTGFLIGTLTTLFMLPLAVILGMLAGYFRGWVDDIIQYLYTTLSSVPGVLLITAVILSLQVIIANHPAMFPTLAERADARLLALCAILGITSWTSLCRLLRGETLKLHEVEFVEAAITLGTRPYKILIKHVLPNVLHIILMTVVLDFSGLVLAEAVLSYVGVGVDPITLSWGNMINSARLELAREPIIWWPLLAAFLFMFVLVLAANLFADAVRDAFDPHLREVN
jgi:peptide/nickel transport system permease protein